MATINVGQVPEGVARDLKLRAARNNRSLEDEVRHILESAVRNDMAATRPVFHAQAAVFRNELAGCQHTSAELLIRDDRDFGH